MHQLHLSLNAIKFLFSSSFLRNSNMRESDYGMGMVPYLYHAITRDGPALCNARRSDLQLEQFGSTRYDDTVKLNCIIYRPDVVALLL